MRLPVRDQVDHIRFDFDAGLAAVLHPRWTPKTGH
jgi:hypothetical protein